MSEVWGLEGAVKHIWDTFEAAYATKRLPTQDIMNDLLHGPVIPHADAKTMRRFMVRCRTALNTTTYDKTVEATLDSSENQNAIVRRLGNTVYQEWVARRNHLESKQKTVTFSTLCEWLKVKTKNLSDYEEPQIQLGKSTSGQAQSRESGSRDNTYWQTQNRYTQNQGQRGQYNRYQAGTQSRTQSTPGAPVFCAWCKDKNRADGHSTKTCNRFKQANIADRWTTVSKYEVCPLCLIGKHSLGRCPAYRGEDSQCQQCKFHHSSDIGCRPLPNGQFHQKRQEKAFLTFGRSHRHSNRTPQQANRTTQRTLHVSTSSNSSNGF